MLPDDIRTELYDALIQAYDLSEMKVLLRVRVHKHLEDAARKGTRPAVFNELIETAQHEGWDFDLILAASNGRPRNGKLRSIVDRLFVPASEPHLQKRLYESVPDLDPVLSRSRQEALEPTVCVIEMRTNAGMMTGGTGFLVAPDLVLTACHVMQPVIDGRADDVAVRFDYKRLQGSQTSWGVYYKLHSDWPVASSPESPMDTRPDPPREPSRDELDFVLIRIDGSPGTDPIGAKVAEPGAPTRGWVRLEESAEYWPDSPLQILHHGQRPDGYALSLGIETRSIIGLNDNRTRLRHRTNTYDGSSGAPCFDADWKLIALHHAAGSGKHNVAIPIGLITEAVRKRTKVPEPPPLP
jgi:hypothetical protein